MNKTELLKSKVTEFATDALLVTSAVNQRYVTGFDYSDGYALITKNAVYLITDFRYIEAAKAQANEGVTVLMPADGERMSALIRRLLDENDAKNVLVEEYTLSINDYELLKKNLGKGIKLGTGASVILDAMRMYKTADEIATMQKAQDITDAAFSHILDFIKPDMTEIEVALELEFFMRSHGAEAEAFQTIAVSGSNSSRPHGVPRKEKLEKGFFTMDFGAKVDGYCSDMTRTVVLGKADDEMKRLYNTVLEAQLAGLEAVKVGADLAGCDKIARDIIDGAGYKGAFGHSLGHGVGMYIHEEPRLSFRASGKLEVGNVVTVEPGIYLEGKYGCRIEDMVAVTENGIHNFTHSPKELIELF